MHLSTSRLPACLLASLLRSTKLPPINNPLLQLPISLLKRVVHNNLIMRPRLLRVLQLMRRLIQPLTKRILRLSPPPAQPPLEFLDRWRRKEEEASVQIGLLHLLHAFHLDIQDRDLLALGDLLHGVDGCAVEVAAELRVLDEAVGGYEGLEGFLGCEVVFAAVFFARAGGAGCVCFVLVVVCLLWFCFRAGGRNGMPRTGNGEGEFAGVFFEKALHESTLSCTARAGDDHWSKLLDCWISIRAGFGAVKGL